MLDPSWMWLKQDMLLLTLMLPIAERLEPKRLKWRTEMLLPRCAKFNTLKEEPARMNERTLKLLPRWQKSMIDAVYTDPILVIPWIEIVEPILTNCRTETELPCHKKFNTESELPMRM
jgi:hypothetical protein